MRVEKFTLRNFRNIEECTFYPNPRLNFFVGQNGQGKTSILEALAYLASLRSFRGSRTSDVIRYGAEESEIHCILSAKDQLSEQWKTDLRLFFSFSTESQLKKKAVKIAFVNGKPFKSPTQYLSQRFGSFELGFHSIVFNPSDHELIRGEPNQRRTFLDRVLAAEDIEYLRNYIRFQKTLEQRNFILRSEQTPDLDLLIGFTGSLVKLSAYLAYKRLEWIKRLNAELPRIISMLAPHQPPMKVVYVSQWVDEIDDLCISNNDLGSIHFTGQDKLPSLELLEKAFWNKVSSVGMAEWKARHSLVGPQRDDWAFLFGNSVLKGHGSQGEVRTALLALKLAEVELFRRRTGHRPLFLLDDFSSELDRERRSFLLDLLKETDLQVFITTTEERVEVAKYYWVSNGNLIESGHDHARERSEIRTI